MITENTPNVAFTCSLNTALKLSTAPSIRTKFNASMPTSLLISSHLKASPPSTGPNVLMITSSSSFKASNKSSTVSNGESACTTIQISLVAIVAIGEKPSYSTSVLLSHPAPYSGITMSNSESSLRLATSLTAKVPPAPGMLSTTKDSSSNFQDNLLSCYFHYYLLLFLLQSYHKQPTQTTK